MDRSAALRPLEEAAEPIRALSEYGSPTELNTAVAAVAAAVDRALRLALRTDPDASEDHRLSALSPAVVLLEEVVQSLRSRDRISLETAGAVHELAAAAERARADQARPDDADAAARAVAGLRRDLGAAAAPSADLSRSGPGSTAPPPRPRPVATGRGRWMAWVGSGLAVLVLIGLAWALAGGGQDHFEDGLAAFRAARWDSAAVAFERALQERPVDITTRLYLARTYRRQGRTAEAADVLREAVRVAPEDADVRRELGRVFMDLGQPESAVRQFELALEHDPDSPLSWAALIQALEAVGDPRAADMLDRAPPEVQATLRQPRPRP
jgi:tetratricopeptide (TPR) repeat protein